MGKIGTYQPTEQYKNYSLPTAKPLRSHAFYKEKVWTLQERIYKKLRKVAGFLECLHPKLTDDFSKNIKTLIEKNLKTLIKDLNLMQANIDKNPDSFNTDKLKTNQHRITEMKNICDILQTVRSYEYEFKNLGKIKHILHELEHLIQPTPFEKSLEKMAAKSKPKSVATKKQHSLVKAKKVQAAPKLPKQTKAKSKQPKKVVTPTHKAIQPEKKAPKTKAKTSTEAKKK